MRTAAWLVRVTGLHVCYIDNRLDGHRVEGYGARSQLESLIRPHTTTESTMYAIIAFVSILSATALKGPSVTMRPLVQGSGTVVCFEHASDMPRHAVSFVRGGK